METCSHTDFLQPIFYVRQSSPTSTWLRERQCFLLSQYKENISSEALPNDDIPSTDETAI